MADKKVTELTAITNLSGDDLLLVVNDPLGTPGSRKITVDNVFGNVATNASFTGDRVSVSANLYYQGSELNSIIDTKISVANASIAEAALQSDIDDRMQVANTVALVNDRLQVANAAATYATKAYAASNSFLTSVYVANTYFQGFLTLAQEITQANNLVADSSVNTAIIRVSSASGIQATKGSAPSSNNTATEGVPVGTIFFSNNHLYIATDATTIKRVSLEVFS
jgi:hypothetical protein